MTTSLTITESQLTALVPHLFPADGNEAVAFLLCGRRADPSRTRLLVRKVILMPNEVCAVREPDRVTWPTEWLVPLLNEATRRGLSLIKIHGHRVYDRFSPVDDQADRALFPGVCAWTDSDAPHGSAILMDDGRLFGRIVQADGAFQPLDWINVVGSDLLFWYCRDDGAPIPESAQRITQVFGERTFAMLRRLRIAVVGCSGTGSPVVEQLVRNHVGSLVLVDPDIVENKNLNRIWNATAADARQRAPKVEVAARAAHAVGFGTEIVTLQKSLFDPEAVRAVAACDAVFGCVDSVDGRYLLNKLAVFYAMPYFDLGVRIDADGHGGVDQVCGSVHYLQPDGSSLLSRGAFDMEQVRAAGLQRTNPQEFSRLAKEGYIKGAAVDRPAVIQLNTLIASLAINDFLARLHPFRLDSNAEIAVIRVSLSHNIFQYEQESLPCGILSRHVGRGDTTPLLDMPELS